MRFRPTYGNIWGVTWPLILAGISETVIDVTDTIFLAHYGTAELAAIASVLGKLPSPEEYQQYAEKIDTMAPDIYRYLNFDRMPEFVASAKRGQEVVLKLAI